MDFNADDFIAPVKGDFNADDFIAAIQAGRPYRGWLVEVRIDLPNRNPWQAEPTRMVYLDRFDIAHVFPCPDPELGPRWDIRWTLNRHNIYHATYVLNVLGNGLLGRPLVRRGSGMFHQIRFDGTHRWEEVITTPIRESSNVPGEEK